MKKLFLLLLLIFYSKVSQSQDFGEPDTPLQYVCYDCNDVDSSIISFNSSNDLIEASTSIDAQAYYWEICGSNTSISGSNTNSEVLIDYESNVKVILTVFQDGDCVSYCRELTGSVDPEPEPDPATCCPPNIFISVVSRPNAASSGAVSFDPNPSCDFDWSNIEAIDLTISGMTINEQGFYGQNSAYLDGPFNITGSFVMGLYNSDTIPSVTATATIYFNNNCDPIVITYTYDNPNWRLNEANESDIEVYPNPTKNNLKFKVENLNNPKVEIFDFKGKKVLESNNLEKSLSIEKLKNGKYIYNIYDNNEIIKKGIIVKE